MRETESKIYLTIEIIEKLNLVTYRLDLPVELKHVHNVFHISQLRKYIPDPTPLHLNLLKPLWT